MNYPARFSFLQNNAPYYLIILNLFFSTYKYGNSEVAIGVTGIQSLFRQLAVQSKNDFLIIDAVVIPIAILILGFNIR